jgi:hypothetical protein
MESIANAKCPAHFSLSTQASTSELFPHPEFASNNNPREDVSFEREYRESMARETSPGMVMITSSSAPDSPSSVTGVCRLLWSAKERYEWSRGGRVRCRYACRRDGLRSGPETGR